MRSVLFSGEKVTAKEAVVLLFGSFACVVGRAKGCRTACAARGALRSAARFDGSESVKMLSFDLCYAGKEVFELCIVSALGMACVFVDTKLLLVLHVLQ